MVGIAAKADMRDDRAALLRQARDLQHHGGLLVQMRRHADDAADGQHTRPADAGDRDVERRVQGPRHRRLRQVVGLECDAFAFARLHALDGDEGGAEALRDSERSTLQADWLISRLRPSGVSLGSIAMQLLCTEQSPQPSQTGAG